MSLDLHEIYKSHGALLRGHFLLSSGKHSDTYLQSARVLEHPHIAETLALALKNLITNHRPQILIDAICSPALGGILAGYELARALNVRFFFTERVNGEMTLRRGFDVKTDEKILICEDIITTGGSAMEAGACVEKAGGRVVAFAGLANRGFCGAILPDPKKSKNHDEKICRLPVSVPLFALENFVFDTFSPENCPLCAHSVAIKPGSRGN